MQAAVLGGQVEFFRQPLLTPLRLSTGSIAELTEARATVAVRIDGREQTGRGAIYLSDLWAWPDLRLSHPEREAILVRFCRAIAGRLAALCGDEPAHPLELGLRLHHATANLPALNSPPALARALCASPFDAALHDAVGQARGRNAMDLYTEDTALPSADSFFESRKACRAIARVIQPPSPTLEAWWIVCPDDALPDSLVLPVRRRGIRCFKLKINGRSAAEDAALTSAVHRALRAMGTTRPRLSVDSNEANPDAESVRAYLERLRADDPEAFAVLDYLEQPTSRDIFARRFDWRAVTRLKPVMLDEGLTDLSVLEAAVEQGWSGFALKTCKGHSFALAVAAWAHERGLPLTVQDLTNPGLAAIHAALMAARIPTLNGVELNSPQYTPDANAAWLPRLTGLFEPRHGRHDLAGLRQAKGLGSAL